MKPNHTGKESSKRKTNFLQMISEEKIYRYIYIAQYFMYWSTMAFSFSNVMKSHLKRKDMLVNCWYSI